MQAGIAGLLSGRLTRKSSDPVNARAIKIQVTQSFGLPFTNPNI